MIPSKLRRMLCKQTVIPSQRMRRRLAGFIMPDVATGSSSAQLGDAPGGGNKLARPPGRYARKNAGLVCCMLLADTPVRNGASTAAALAQQPEPQTQDAQLAQLAREAGARAALYCDGGLQHLHPSPDKTPLRSRRGSWHTGRAGTSTTARETRRATSACAPRCCRRQSTSAWRRMESRA